MQGGFSIACYIIEKALNNNSLHLAGTAEISYRVFLMK